MPFQRQLAFPSKNGPNPQTINLISPVASDFPLSLTEKPRLQMPELIRNVPLTNPSPIDTSERLAEDERVSKWNAKSHSQSEDVCLVSIVDSVVGKSSAISVATSEVASQSYFENVCVASIIESPSDEILAVSRDRSDSIVTDSRATNTVVGKRWLGNYSKSRTLLGIAKSSLSFKFGDSRIFGSFGGIGIPLGIPCESLAGQSSTSIQCIVTSDIIDSDIPLLVSRHALRLMRRSLDFAQNSLSFEGYKIQLSLAENGHLLIPYQVADQLDVVDPQCAFAGETLGSRVASPELIRKIHLHLPHTSKAGIIGALSQSGYEVNPEEIERMLRQCPCLSRNTH